MDLIIESLPLLVDGLLVTFQLAVLTLLCATVLSVIFGLMGASRHWYFRIAALVYVEFFRDIPLVVNLLFVYFGAPLIGIPLDPFSAALVSFSSWGGANGAEIVRGGFNAISKHQRESAMALGLKPWESVCFVLAPQVLLPIIPAFTGLFSILVQATSLASLVGALELFRSSQIIVERSTMMTGYSPAFTVYGVILCVYFVICFFLTWLSKRLEKRLSERAAASVRGTQKLDQRAAESV